MENLFICRTPYHLILSVGTIKNKYKNDDNTIILIKDFDISNIDIENIKLNCKKLLVLDGNNTVCNRKIAKFYLPIKQIELLHKSVNIKNISKIIIFNDSNILEQYIMNKVYTNNCEIIAFEDGSCIYNNNKIYKSNIHKVKFKFKSIFYKILLNTNMKFIPIDVLGESAIISKIYACYPNCVRNELKNKIINEIKQEIIYDGISIIYNKLTVNYFNNINSIIFLDHSDNDFTKDYKYKKIILEVLNKLSEKNGGIYLKYHPRESIEYIDYKKIEYKNIKIIDKGLPSELIFSKVSSPVLIMSSSTTSLITAKKMMPDAEVVSIIDLINIETELRNVFYKIGVSIPKNINDLYLLMK